MLVKGASGHFYDSLVAIDAYGAVEFVMFDGIKERTDCNNYTPAQRSCWGVYWFHSVCLSFHPSVPHPLCSAYNSGWIHFIFIHLIKQLYFGRWVTCKVSCETSKYKFWQCLKICNFDFVLFWLGIWCESLVWVIVGRQGVSQNAGILVVLVISLHTH